ncbi:PucR family transcriptional regulator [Solirubrobacter soli]|uniref:PucR family transcriptional regulator n=1 Tax=Solirubrobacter soli TaxID=363832 RepID=UPI00040572A9|nr:helix-turn-helix domain-containing protein [Solirubrobacter soli]
MAASLVDLHNRVLDAMELDAEAIARRMLVGVRAEVEEFASVRDPAFVAEVLEHSVAHVHAFLKAARACAPPAGAELDFVRERGARRARDLLGLDALLEAYLIGQRTVWEAIVEKAGDSPEGMRAAQDLTAFTFRYTHAISVAVAEAYLRESHALASETERARRDLLDRLLAGQPPDDARAEALGLRPASAHVVVVATPADRLVLRALARECDFVVADLDEVVAIAPVYVRRGPRELRGALERTAHLLERNHELRLRAGVSSTCPRLEELTRGYGEARRALRHAAPVAALEEIGLFDYLTEAADDTAHRLLPRGLDQLGNLAETLHAYAAADLNVARTAAALGVHPNTVHYRLTRVQELTGRDPRRFAELVELTAALRIGYARNASSIAAPDTSAA